jgi:hypothetical protein
MKEIYALIVRALKPRIAQLTDKDIQHTFASWELIPLMRNTNLVGVALRKESELHLIIDPEFQNTICFLKQSKQIVEETIAKYGYADTKVSNEHTLGHRLAKILGFNVVGTDLETTHYKKEE